MSARNGKGRVRLRGVVFGGGIVFGLLLGAYLTAIAAGRGTTVGALPTPVPPPDIPFDDCATTDFSLLETGEVNTNFIYEFSILQMSALGPEGVDVQFNVDINDPDCQAIPVVKTQIDAAVQMVQEGLATECPAIQAYVDAGATTNERGEPIDLEAAQAFLDQWCGDVSPSPSTASPSPSQSTGKGNPPQTLLTRAQIQAGSAPNVAEIHP